MDFNNSDQQQDNHGNPESGYHFQQHLNSNIADQHFANNNIHSTHMPTAGASLVPDFNSSGTYQTLANQAQDSSTIGAPSSHFNNDNTLPMQDSAYISYPSVSYLGLLNGATSSTSDAVIAASNSTHVSAGQLPPERNYRRDFLFVQENLGAGSSTRAVPAPAARSSNTRSSKRRSNSTASNSATKRRRGGGISQPQSQRNLNDGLSAFTSGTISSALQTTTGSGDPPGDFSDNQNTGSTGEWIPISAGDSRNSQQQMPSSPSSQKAPLPTTTPPAVPSRQHSPVPEFTICRVTFELYSTDMQQRMTLGFIDWTRYTRDVAEAHYPTAYRDSASCIPVVNHQLRHPALFHQYSSEYCDYIYCPFSWPNSSSYFPQETTTFL